MVRYVFRCDEQHRFEAWFHSEADNERALALGETRCPLCEIAALETLNEVSVLAGLEGGTSGLVLQ